MVETVIDPTAGSGAFLTDTSPELRERIARIRKTFWVTYPAGRQALEHLESLFDHPKTHRPPCCTLYGDTNSGKTQIALKFERDHKPAEQKGDEQAVMPVVLVQNPPFGDVRSFYSQILARIGAPRPDGVRPDRALAQVLVQLDRLKARVLIVDEVQHVLAGKIDQRMIFMNSLKFLSNELQIPVVAIGPIGALRALYTDPQLANRFEALQLPRWQPDRDYAEFLTQLTAQMGLGQKSEFKKKDLVTRVHSMTEGLTGETRALIGRAAETAMRSGREVIDMETLEETPWHRPGDRKRNAG